jgi:uncharacterized protein
VQIAAIKDDYARYEELDKRREAIINSITEQGLMTPDLQEKLEKALIMVELEDLYLPYKPKRKTRASVAREKGLEPLATLILKQQERDLNRAVLEFINEGVENEDDALQGARDIIAEWINEDQQARNSMRNLFSRGAVITSTLIKGKDVEGQKYKDYFDFSEPLGRCPSHRLLAIFRGEEEGFLKVVIEPD